MAQPTNQLPGESPGVETLDQPATILHSILRKTYDEIKALSAWLKENTIGYLIGEHQADEDAPQLHCHILIEGLKVTREALRKQIVKLAPGRGQNCTMSHTQSSRVPYNKDLLAIYILKGTPAHFKDSSYTPEQILDWIARWRFHDEKPVLISAELVKVKKPKTIYDNCQEIAQTLEWVKNPGQMPHLVDRTTIVTAIIKWANANRVALNAYKVADYYDIILSNCLPEYYDTLCRDLINRRHRSI